MKKHLFNILLLALSFTIIFASNSFAQENNKKEKLKKQFEEINEYLSKQDNSFELTNQKNEYIIELSDGTTAKVSNELVKKPTYTRKTYDAKLGRWDFISNYDLGPGGLIKVITEIEITEVPGVNSDGSFVKFYASNPRLITTPPNGFHRVDENIYIEDSDGYQSSTRGFFGIAGYPSAGIDVNYYFNQRIHGVGYAPSDKIECVLNVTLW